MQKFDRKVRAVGGILPAAEPAAAIKIRGDADVLHADATHGVVDVIDEVRDCYRVRLCLRAEEG